MPISPEYGLSARNGPMKPVRPSWPPKVSEKLAEPMVCRMISAAAMVTIAR